jgi:hypothetical protein
MLVDIQTGWKTLGEAGRCSDRMANTWTGWQMFRQDSKQLERLADTQTEKKTLGQAGRYSDKIANTWTGW